MNTQRYDLYGPIHKGLRAAHGEWLTQLGRADFAEPADLLASLRRYLTLCASHLEHEDRFVHPLLEWRAAGTTAEVASQHEEHLVDFARIERAIIAVQQARPCERLAAGRDLYLTFSAFVAGDLAHMHWEETVLFGRLCAHFRDEELEAMETAIIGSLTPQETVTAVRVIMPALNPAERDRMLAALRLAAPPEAFDAIVEYAVRPALGSEDLAALGLAA